MTRAVAAASASVRRRKVPARARAPRLVVESELRAGGYLVVAGVDEVGRGCLAGPVTVGVVVVDPGTARPPRGLRDSKLLTPQERTALVPRIQRWVDAFAVGHASAAEIDAYGLIAALRLAGHRALAQLPQSPDCVLLDGNHDYLTPPAQLGLDDLVPPPDLLDEPPAVRTKIKADLTCASVAAASVLAKTVRDALMVELASSHPEYGWEINKGYATPYHRAALREHGATAYHRLSWRLGVDDDGLDGDGLDDEVLDDGELLGDGEGDGEGGGGQDGPVAAYESETVIDLSREVRA